MLKIYSSLDEVPEALREHYKLSGGKYVPELSDDHPVVVNNKQLLLDKSKAVSRSEELTADLEVAKQSSLPRGHIAVSKADHDLLEKVKVHGTSDEVVKKLDEHKTLKEETDRRKRQDSLTDVAKELGYMPEAFVRLQGLPDFEIREKDGKKTVIAKVKDGNTTVEKDASEYVEAEFAPFLPALKAEKNGTRYHGSQSNNGAPPKDVFTKIREKAKEENKQRNEDLHPMFNKIPGRTVAQTGD